MNKQRSKTTFFATITLLLGFLARLISQSNDPQLLLGLSSQFWSGTLIGFTAVSTVATIYLFVTLPRSESL